jgi:light-regulated signal transduction histidine kinase (bacteriophytochrome)
MDKATLNQEAVMQTDPLALALALLLALTAMLALRSLSRARAAAGTRALNAALEAKVARLTAELAAGNRELESFSKAVSHDLRSPLHSITGWTEALAEDYADKLDDQGKTYLNTIRQEVGRMDRLIDALLQLSRVTRAEMHAEPLNLSEIVTELVGPLRQAQPERNVRITIQPGIMAPGDPVLIRLALQHLLRNAWTFSSLTPEAVIQFGAREVNGTPAFFVRDNGAGFDMAYADRLFIPFQRLHRQTDFPGIGMGLAIAHRIITRHGGRLWAEGKPGEGATFLFTLPGERS